LRAVGLLAWHGPSAAQSWRAMGGSQPRCCASPSDQHQVNLSNLREAYASLELEVANSHTQPQGLQPDPRVPRPPEFAAAVMLHSAPCVGALASCCVQDSLPNEKVVLSEAEQDWLPQQHLVKKQLVADDINPDVMGGEVLLVDLARPDFFFEWGLTILHRGAGILVIAEIQKGGAAEAANLKNTRAGTDVLEVGDQVALINGVGGDDLAMAEEFRQSKLVTLGVRRTLRGKTVP